MAAELARARGRTTTEHLLHDTLPVMTEELHLDAIRPQELQGKQLRPDGSFEPMYTAIASGPEVSRYLVHALDEAIGLLREVQSAAPAQLRPRIDRFLDTV